MMIELTVDSVNAEDDLVSLAHWLQVERDLVGRVNLVRGAIREYQLGGAFELITVALGSGGIGSVLASSVTSWLQNRPKTTIKITRDGTSIEIDANSLKRVPELVEKLLADTKSPDA
ncbi:MULTISPECIES: effector-associated constant component EACC1 [Amycolatopsis]|uniref:effector-associated constant component EACC1 n=1 Tax=Amycolatopsis TaxID=1813 RepID=UPI003642D370